MKRHLTLFLLLLMALPLMAADSFLGSKPVTNTMHATTNYFPAVLGSDAGSIYRLISPSNLVSVENTVLMRKTNQVGEVIVTGGVTVSEGGITNHGVANISGAVGVHSLTATNDVVAGALTVNGAATVSGPQTNASPIYVQGATPGKLSLGTNSQFVTWGASSDGGILLGNTNQLVVNSTNGNVGVGTNLPQSRLHVVGGGLLVATNNVLEEPIRVGRNSSLSSDSMVLVARNVLSIEGAGATNSHAFSDSTTWSRTNASSAYNSYDARVSWAQTNMDHYAAFQALPSFAAGAGLETYYGLYSSASLASGTKVNHLYGYRFIPTISSGAIANNVYGLSVEPALSGTVATYWGLYVKSPTGSATPTSEYGIQIDALNTSSTYHHIWINDANARLSFGTGKDMIICRDGTSNQWMQLWIDTATPLGTGIKGNDASGSNARGGDMYVASGRGTGTANPGEIIFMVAGNGSSGSSQNALVERVRISNAGPIAYLAGAIQTVAAGTAITNNSSKVKVAGSGGAVTSTATPTLQTNRVSDGMIVLIQGTDDTNTWTAQDEGGLAGSALQLGAASRALGKGDILQVMWDQTDGVWYEVSFTNN